MDYEMLAKTLNRLEARFRTASTVGDYRYIYNRARALPGLRAEQIACRAEGMVDLMQAMGIGVEKEA